jgi:cytochrome P450
MGLVSSPITLVVAGALLSYLIFSRLQLYLNRRSFIRQNGCEPCPKRYNKDPILGWDVIKQNIANKDQRKMLERNQQRFKDMGVNTYLTRMLHMPMITTCEPENIKTVLSLRFKDYSFGNRYLAFAPLLGDGIFNSDGEKWQNSRHLLRPNFARDQIADLEAFDRHFKLMLKQIPRDGSTVDLQTLFFKLTIDSATEFLFNHSTNSLRMSEDETDNEDAIFARAFQFAQDDIITRLRWNALNFLRSNKEGEDALKICHTYVDKFVDEAIREHQADKAAGKSDDDRYIFIKELVKQTNDKTRIRSELMNILLAGRDTTASLLSNMFFQIALRPDIWAKLREEVAPLEGRLPTYEELRNMKYLKYCLNECKSTSTSLPSVAVPSLAMLISFSTPHPPRGSWQHSFCYQRYHPSSWRRPRRQGSFVRSQRHHRCVLPVHHAAPYRFLRTRCRRVQARALGESPPRLGVLAFQRRSTHLPGPAVRAH